MAGQDNALAQKAFLEENGCNQGRLVVKAAKAAAYPVYHLLIFFLRSKIFLPILVFHTTIDNIFFEKNNFCTKNGNT